MISNINNQTSKYISRSTNMQSRTFEDLLTEYNSSSFKPKEFLKTLNNIELSTIKTEMRLTEDLNINTMTNEGARNLLLNRHEHYAFLDLNADRVIERGNERLGMFPSSAVPNEVMEAWKSATANLSESDLLDISHGFWGLSMLNSENTFRNGLHEAIDPRDSDFVDYFVTDIPRAMGTLFSAANEGSFVISNPKFTQVAKDFLINLENHYGTYEKKSNCEIPLEKKNGYQFLKYLERSNFISTTTFLDMLKAYE